MGGISIVGVTSKSALGVTVTWAGGEGESAAGNIVAEARGVDKAGAGEVLLGAEPLQEVRSKPSKRPMVI